MAENRRGCVLLLLILGGAAFLGSLPQKHSEEPVPTVKPMAINVQPWPPLDPNEEVAKVELNSAWAKRLMGFKSLDELQKAAGSKGKITYLGSADDPAHPFVSFHWMNIAKPGRPGGFMTAMLAPDGSVGVSVLSTDAGQIVFNTNGGFMCDYCKPPISVRK